MTETVCATVTLQIQPYLGGEQEHKHIRVVVEVVHQSRPETHWCASIHSVVGPLPTHHQLLKDVQHLLSLTE